MTRALAVALLAAACGGGGTTQPETHHQGAAWHGPLTPKPAGAVDVVARVGTAEIWDVDVALHAGAHGLTARAALDELIATELLAQEAARRGLADDPDVAEVRDREAVRRLVDSWAATTAAEKAIPDADVQTVFKRSDVQIYLNHPEIREVTYIRVHVKRVYQPPEVERLRVLAEEIHAALVAAKVTTPEKMVEVAGPLAAKAGVKLETAPFSTMAGDKAAPVFRDATFALRGIGAFSPVTRTPWGWDIIMLTAITPPVATTFEQAADDIRHKMWPDWRRVKFLEWTHAFKQGVKIELHPEPLAPTASGGPAT